MFISLFFARYPGHADDVTMFCVGSVKCVDETVSRLSGKIDKDFERPLLHTVRGAGYRLEA